MPDVSSNPPKLVKRREHKNSSFRAGRTIGERREKLETANERAAARKKVKKKKAFRVIFTLAGFSCLVFCLGFIFWSFLNREEVDSVVTEKISEPSVEIIDETAAVGGQITARMKKYIGQVEAELRLVGITPIKAVIPARAVREVDFYIKENSYVKMLSDRGAAVSAEDAKRLLEYLETLGVEDFEYIDVRIEGKAYWK